MMTLYTVSLPQKQAQIRAPFNEWFAQAPTTPRRGPPDDLIADLKVDDTCPPIYSLADLREYLERCNACWECIAAARPVWQRYERWLARRMAR
jgi:hypothetical protein